VNEIGYVAAREIKIGFRNPWAYSFMALFALFMLSLLLINAQSYVKGYSGISGTMLNLALYLLPLMALMLGAFSLTGEK
jgi:Cu-processing system permease protein